VTTTAELTAQLRALSSEQLSVPEEQLRADARLGDDLGVDSLAAIEWGMSIEDAFGISIPEQAWEPITTYGMVEHLVRELVGASTQV